MIKVYEIYVHLVLSRELTIRLTPMSYMPVATYKFGQRMLVYIAELETGQRYAVAGQLYSCPITTICRLSLRQCFFLVRSIAQPSIATDYQFVI